MKDLAGKRVFVGLSGGVDSAVSAALLLERGADVTGVFIKGWYPPGMPCTWSEDRRDAMRAAAHLGIPFHTLDSAKEYKEGVIDYLLSEYAQGRTPNPDIMCNKEVKFGTFWKFAQVQGADYLATGHYAQNKNGRIYRGIDEAKDQSYFLWAAAKEALTRTLFPLGDIHKEDTRKLALKFCIPQATKKDSQGVCFLGSISMEDFLRNELVVSPGKALDVDGQLLGTHAGSILATLGERVSLVDSPPGPWYVLAKDMEINTLTVGHSPQVTKKENAITLTETHLLTTEAVEGEIEAQYRYHGPRITGVLSADATAFTLSAPLQEVVAPGQSLVLYKGGELLGGGIIQ